MPATYVPPIPPNPTVRPVATRPTPVHHDWDVPERGIWRVTGVAGSGVSSFLVDTVVGRIRAGWDPSSLLVVTASKEAASRLRREISDRIADLDYVSGGKLVRSVHSLAFALIRDVDDDIRLITGAEQDAVIRELLRGHADDERGSWPEEQRGALRMVGFARQLRDFLLRAVERGLGAADLIRLGNEHGRQNWIAAGEFLREYREVMALSGARSLSASELVTVALDSPTTQEFRGVFVDDAQHLDPKSAELVQRFLPAELAVIAGDPEQSVFHFRGANPRFLLEVPADREVHFETSYRHAECRVAIAATESAHNDLIADTIRRAHLIDEVPWQDMAVVVRSAGMVGPVRRCLLAAGVPVHVDPTEVVLSEQRIVMSMMLGLRALNTDLSPLEMEQLLLGPIGGADPVTLRRLLRGLRQAEMRAGGTRRAMDVLTELIRPGSEIGIYAEFLTDREAEFLTDREAELLARIRSVILAGHEAEGSIEEILWALWSATGLSDRLAAASLRGGAAGSQADRDLDAMMALFDAAGDYVERRPTASLDSFIQHITEQELPTGVRERRGVSPDAVSVVTAHSSAGLQWHTVVVADVQEGSWPALGETGTLLGQEELVDLVDEGIDPDLQVFRAADRLAEERRLFHVAITRATDTVLVTAVESPDADDVREPSRFLDELGVEPYRVDGNDDADMAEPAELGHRLLSVPAVVAELRRELEGPRRRQAARQLLRLRDAGVAGADPETWAGFNPPSTEAELLRPGQVSLSPSRIEALMACPLRAVLDRLDSEEQAPIAMLKGTLVHAYAETIARGADADVAAEMVQQAYLDMTDVPEWSREATTEAFARLLERTRSWLTTSRSAFEQVGVEMDVDVEIDERVRIRGRMDRLERTADGELVVVDIKTGRTALPQKDMADHAQLAAYQLALSRGTVSGDRVITGDGEPVGGGQLVYPGSSTVKITCREQVAKTPEELDEFAAMLPALAEQMRGPRLLARVNPTCSTCPVRPLCPVQPEGQMITDA